MNIMKTATWIILLLFFVGCQQSPKVPNLEHTLSCVLQFTKSEETFEAKFISGILGKYHFIITSPSALQGMEVLVEQGRVTYTFQGLTKTQEEFQDRSLCKQTAKIWEQTVRGEGIAWQSFSEQWLGKGVYNGDSFTIVCDKQTNHPVSLETQDGLVVKFKF